MSRSSISTSGSTSARTGCQSSLACALGSASINRRTTSTFSCDIARAVSRLAVRLPMAPSAERFTGLLGTPALADRRVVVGNLSRSPAANADTAARGERPAPEGRLLPARSALRDLALLPAAAATAAARDHRAAVEAGTGCHQR